MKAINIGSKTFVEYIGKRLVKDGLGYVPASKWNDGETDAKTFIKAIIPKTPYDFLVYAHELGHCKAPQKPRMHHSVYMFFGVDENTVYNEFMAWDWAFRYMRRLGLLSIPKDVLERALHSSLGSYIRKAQQCPAFANMLVRKYSEKWGLKIDGFNEKPFANSPTVFFTESIFTGGVDVHRPIPGSWVPLNPVKKKKPTSKNWKPWHEIQEANNRKWHKNRKFV